MKYTIYNEFGEWWTGKKWGELADRLIYLSRDSLPKEVGDLFYGMSSEGPLEHLYFCVDECAPGGRSPRAWVLEHPADGRTLPGVSKKEVFDIKKVWHCHEGQCDHQVFEWGIDKSSYRLQVLNHVTEGSNPILRELEGHFETAISLVDLRGFSYSSEEEELKEEYRVLEELVTILKNQANRVEDKLNGMKKDALICDSINKTKSDPYAMIRKMSEEDRKKVFEFAMKRSKAILSGKG